MEDDKFKRQRALFLRCSDVNNTETAFPSDKEAIVLYDFTYEAQRMGAAPTLTASFMYPRCLDDEWTAKEPVFTEFNGEKYYLKNVPTSSKNSDDARYKHDAVFVSERSILEYVYMNDAVKSSETESEQLFVSNGTKVFFVGNLSLYVKKIGLSMEYSKIPYSFDLKDLNDVKSEEKQITLEDKTLMEAIQEINNTFKVQYYFEGHTIHIGKKADSKALNDTVFEYGANNSLVSISKNNANSKLVTKIIPSGSDQNIPYYYPNEFPNGELVPVNNKEYEFEAYVKNRYNLCTRAYVNTEFTAKLFDLVTLSHAKTGVNGRWWKNGALFVEPFEVLHDTTLRITSNIIGSAPVQMCRITISSNPKSNKEEKTEVFKYEWRKGEKWDKSAVLKEVKYEKDREYAISLYQEYSKAGDQTTMPICWTTVKVEEIGWEVSNGKAITPKEGEEKKEEKKDLDYYGIGIRGIVRQNEKITLAQKPNTYLFPQKHLMPKILRDTNGSQSYYLAKDNIYSKEDGSKYTFVNQYVDVRPYEHVERFEDIKPTIENVKNAGLENIDCFEAFEFDTNDNNEKYETSDSLKYKHPIFFAKMKKTDGENGFNLFESAIEGQPMKIHFTTGVCAGYTFEVAVDSNDNQTNLVQVNDLNVLLRDGEGDVRCGREGKNKEVGQNSQQDTRAKSIWLALRKDKDTTPSQVMPDKKHNLVPSPKDKFVILDIHLPMAYIKAAEKKLEIAALDFMEKNNVDKFNFNIKPSRIFFENNRETLSTLDENSSINLKYNNRLYNLFVKNFKYRCTNDDVIPEISIDVNDDVSILQSTFQSIVGNITNDVISKIGGTGGRGNKAVRGMLDQATIGGQIDFTRKQTFSGGMEVGSFSEGNSGAAIDDMGNAEFESIVSRSSISSIENVINQIRVVGGDLLLTEGDVIERVEEIESQDGSLVYGLHLRANTPEYHTKQVEGNVIKGVINTLHSGNTFFTSWMKVLSVYDNSNYIAVVLYDDKDTPSGKNYPPCELMSIARWGNTDKEDYQDCIYISGTEGRIVRLTKVTKPIIDASNYGMSIGTLPEILEKSLDASVINGMDYLYVRGLLYQDSQQIDYLGKPKSQPYDRGNWSPEEQYYSNDFNESERRWEISDVWHVGCKYRCAKTGTKQEPSWKSTDWGMISGNPDFYVRFEDTDVLFDPDNFNLLLKINATLYNQDITSDIKDEDVRWSRYSEDEDGNPRTQSDSAWNIKNESSGKEKQLTGEDCNFEEGFPSKLVFKATVFLRDNDGNTKSFNSAIFKY